MRLKKHRLNLGYHIREILEFNKAIYDPANKEYVLNELINNARFESLNNKRRIGEYKKKFQRHDRAICHFLKMFIGRKDYKSYRLVKKDNFYCCVCTLRLNFNCMAFHKDKWYYICNACIKRSHSLHRKIQLYLGLKKCMEEKIDQYIPKFRIINGI